MSAATVSLTVALSDEFMNDVLITAVEGGIAYWARLVQPGDSPDSYVGMLIEEQEPSEGDTPKRAILNADLVARGIAAALAPTFALNSAIRAAICRGASENDGGEIDVEAADVIVQAGMFGGLIYG